MSSLELSEEEECELYVLLKPREGRLPAALDSLLARIEKALYERLTVEEIEELTHRFESRR